MLNVEKNIMLQGVEFIIISTMQD